MRSTVRVIAEHAGDPHEPQDARWKLVFVGVIDQDRLVHQFCFGYSMEVDSNILQRWPFVLEPPRKEHSAALCFGPESKPQQEPTNVFDRDIRVGTLFTRGQDAEGSTYRIIKVEPFD